MRGVRVLVVGGGVAGIAAAVRCAEAGARVTLFEASNRLGGRASSFDDVRTGEVIDNCQHVAMGCCTNYLDLLDRLGTLDAMAWSETLTFVEPAGEGRGARTSAVRPSWWLPAPLHAGASFARARFLDRHEKRAVARGVLAAIRADRREHAGRTFGDWLAAHGQPARAVARFWRPVIVSACNAEAEALDASVALHVFQGGVFASRAAGAVGVPGVALRELYQGVHAKLAMVDPEDASLGVRKGARVESLDAKRVRLTTGEAIEGDRVICALPATAASKLLPDHHGDTRGRRAGQLAHSPILGVHMVFDRPVVAVAHAVLLDVGTQWVFRKDEEGRVVHAVVSAADGWMELSEGEIADRVLGDLRACFASAGEVELVSVRAVKEKRATFLASPEGERLRPETAGPSGVLLAGDYTRTGWPATMEGATRSGYAAAEVALGVGAGSLMVPDLAPPRLARALRGRKAR
ncbi:MAG: FAD-dependent oxidoreductase [Phycisphaerales bacterium]|nr:MAG: FAD-dependent oxidoreductase [Phycisphaerales bacterium]